MAIEIPELELGPGCPKYVLKFNFNNPEYLPRGIPVYEETQDQTLDRAAKREGRARDSGRVVDRDVDSVDVTDMVDELKAAGFVLVSANARRNRNIDYDSAVPGSAEWYCSVNFTFFHHTWAKVSDPERLASYEQILRGMLAGALWFMNREYDNPLHVNGEVDDRFREGQAHFNAPKRLVNLDGTPVRGRRPQAQAMAVVTRKGDQYFLRFDRWNK